MKYRENCRGSTGKIQARGWENVGKYGRNTREQWVNTGETLINYSETKGGNTEEVKRGKAGEIQRNYKVDGGRILDNQGKRGNIGEIQCKNCDEGENNTQRLMEE